MPRGLPAIIIFCNWSTRCGCCRRVVSASSLGNIVSTSGEGPSRSTRSAVARRAAAASAESALARVSHKTRPRNRAAYFRQNWKAM